MQGLHCQGRVALGHLPGPAHLLGELRGDPFNLTFVVAVLVGHRFQQPGKSGHVEAVHRREIGAAVEGASVRGEEHGHGPAAAAGQHLDRLHVDGIQIGALFTVNFDADEMLVHQRGDGLVLEGLPLHDVAPMAGRIADAEQDGFIFVFGPLQGFLSPRIPVHGVVGVLQEIGAGLAA